ncbi:MAG: DUF6494 family protein [Thiogranum sp.]|jgi:hypothetical protein|nr:DUF6494 family protein [Thiogranum sp.]
MDNEQLQHSLRKFLKQVGITSQQAVEKAIEQALQDGRLQGNERLHAVMRLEVEGLDLVHTVEGDIALE